MYTDKFRNGLRSADIFQYYHHELDCNEQGFNEGVLPKLEEALRDDARIH